MMSVTLIVSSWTTRKILETLHQLLISDSDAYRGHPERFSARFSSIAIIIIVRPTSRDCETSYFMTAAAEPFRAS